MLNSHMKYWTGLRQTGVFCTGPCRAKPRPASPNHHIQQKWEQGTTKVNRHNLLFLEICPSYNFSEAQNFGNQLCSNFQAKKHLT